MTGFQKLSDIVKSKYNCLNYLAQEGFNIHEDNLSYRTKSIHGGNNEECLIVYKDNPDYYIDFKAETKGDVIDLCAEYKYNGDKVRALFDLLRETGASNYGDF